MGYNYPITMYFNHIIMYAYHYIIKTHLFFFLLRAAGSSSSL